MTVNSFLNKLFPEPISVDLLGQSPSVNSGDRTITELANNYLDNIDKMSGKAKALEEKKLNAFLNNVAPPTESRIAELHREVGKVLDKKNTTEQEVASVVRSAFNDERTFDQRIKQVKRLNGIAPSKREVNIEGIPNRGNTCFMNAGFQLIINNPDLLQALVSTYEDLRDRPDIPDFKQEAYEAFLNAVASYEEGLVSEIDLNPLRALFLDPETQMLGAMGDVTEFMTAILEPLDPEKYPHLFFKVREMKTYTPTTSLTRGDIQILQKKNQDLNAHAEDPEWIERELTTFPADGKMQEVKSFLSLILPVPDGKESVSGQSLLNDFFSKKSNSNAENAYFKQGEGVRCFSTKTTQNVLESSPPYLSINFNRYRENGSKIEREVAMPKKMIVPTETGSYEYTLEHIAIHSGLHYLALIKKNDEFFIADDDDVRIASRFDINNFLSTGYAYVYKKSSNQV